MSDFGMIRVKALLNGKTVEEAVNLQKQAITKEIDICVKELNKLSKIERYFNQLNGWIDEMEDVDLKDFVAVHKNTKTAFLNALHVVSTDLNRILKGVNSED